MISPARFEPDVTVLERELAEQIAESDRLRELAHAMAEAPDTGMLLQVVAERATLMCAADAATVSGIAGDEFEIVAAAAAAAEYLGMSFPIKGTITEEVVRDRRTISARNYNRHEASVLTHAVVDERQPGGFVAGPVVLTPLIVHKEVLGVLCIMRAVGREPFTSREERHLAVLADHAAVALKKARLFEAAQAANQAKSAFLATMSHELRTPLTALTGYGELLSDGVLGPLAPAQGDAVERMRMVTHHLAVMIDEILTFASLEAGRERITITDVAPAAVMRAAEAVIDPLAQKKPGVAFVVAADEAITPIRSDEDKIRQILVNLAGNAVKFTDDGEVRITVAECAGEVRFTIADTGIGIADEDLARLFQPFTQVDGSLTRRHGGTGLGLYISNRLAGLIGGRIEAHSVPGEGSTFTLVVPRR